MSNEQVEQFNAWRKGLTEWFMAAVSNSLKWLGDVVGRAGQDLPSTAIVMATPVVLLLIVLIVWTVVRRLNADETEGKSKK